MALNVDMTRLSVIASKKVTAHDNCEVLDLDINGVGSTVFPRDIEVRPGGSDGPRVTAIWDGSIGLVVTDLVVCHEYGEATAWRVVSAGGDKAGELRVAKVWESDFGDIALRTDANGNIAIKSATSAYTFQGVSTQPAIYVESEDVVGVRSLAMSRQSDTVGRAPRSVFLRSRASLTAVQSGDLIGAFNFEAHDGTDYNAAAQFLVEVDGPVSANTVPMAFIIKTSPTNSGGLVDRVHITSGGNVGIGTSSPARRFEAEDSSRFPFRVTSTDSGSNVGPNFEFFRDSSSPAANDDIGELRFLGNDSSGNEQSYAQVRGSIVSPTSGAEDGQLEFLTAKNGDASIVRMLIDEDGNVGIDVSNPGAKLEINGSLKTGGERVVSSETLTTTTSMADTVELAILNSATAKTVTLPAHKADKRITLTSIGVGVWTLSPTSGTIKGSSTATLLQYEDLILHSDGSNWI